MTTILEEAATVTREDRQVAYGHPLDNHGTTAQFWRTYIARRFGVELQITPEDVCWLNVLQKISREANVPKRDNKVDVAGYTANVEMIEDERARRAGAAPEARWCPRCFRAWDNCECHDQAAPILGRKTDGAD